MISVAVLDRYGMAMLVRATLADSTAELISKYSNPPDSPKCSDSALSLKHTSAAEVTEQRSVPLPHPAQVED